MHLALENILKGIHTLEEIHDLKASVKIYTIIIPNNAIIDTQINTEVVPLESPLPGMIYHGIIQDTLYKIHVYTSYVSEGVSLIIQHNPFDREYSLKQSKDIISFAGASILDTIEEYQHPTIIYNRK